MDRVRGGLHHPVTRLQVSEDFDCGVDCLPALNGNPFCFDFLYPNCEVVFADPM
jgi:hypothetical protein